MIHQNSIREAKWRIIVVNHRANVPAHTHRAGSKGSWVEPTKTQMDQSAAATQKNIAFKENPERRTAGEGVSAGTYSHSGRAIVTHAVLVAPVAPEGVDFLIRLHRDVEGLGRQIYSQSEFGNGSWMSETQRGDDQHRSASQWVNITAIFRMRSLRSDIDLWFVLSVNWAFLSDMSQTLSVGSDMILWADRRVRVRSEPLVPPRSTVRSHGR